MVPLHEGFESLQLQPSISAENYVQGVYEGQTFIEEPQYIEEEDHGELMQHRYVGPFANEPPPVYGPQYVYAMAPEDYSMPLDGAYDGRRLVQVQDEQGNVFLTEVAYSAEMSPPPEAAPRSTVHSNQSMGDVSVTVSSVPQRASVGSGQRQVSAGEDSIEGACNGAAETAAVREAPAKPYRTSSLKNMLGGLRRKSEGRDG